ncbi:conserved hypothetical protein [Tenacibaculum litopenaei]|uniref:hypothetical protein n=1 Tax=Tenacibaculum litopenaei TaxID=396016 RepID=UPI003895A308
MSLANNVKKLEFWKNVGKVALPFLLVVVIITLILNNASDIFSGDFQAVYEFNFADGKWKRFWAMKIVVSFFYSIWITNKKMV